MKIMHLCTGYPVSYNGGITNYVRSIAETQKELGMDVVVVGAKDSKKEQFKFKYIEYYDFYVKPFTLRAKKGYMAYKKIEKIIKKEMPDLIHIHMILDVDRRLYKILQKYNIKYIVSLHDYNMLCPRIQMFRDGKPCEAVSDKCKKCAYFIEQTFVLHKIFKTFKLNKNIGKLNSPKFLDIYNENKKLLENAKLLLPVSERVKEIYMKSNISANYQVLHIGNVTAEKFEKYKILKVNKEDKIKITMLGNFSNIKGGDEFLKICDKLSHERFEFYFLGRSSDKEKIMMKEHGIIDKGEYKQNQLNTILKDYDLGCVLSIWEDNAPQVVMELLNNNIPVIGTRMGGIPDFINDGVNGFLYNPYSSEEFEQLIEKLNSLDKEKVEIMKSRVERTKTPAEHYEELEKIYKKILNEK